MGSFVVRRLLLGLLIVWGVYTLTFFAVNLAPGDPFANLENPKMTKDDLDRLRAQWGYDKPVLERYVHQLRKMFWADPDLLSTDAGGVRVDLFAEGEGNAVRATAIPAPEEVRLQPAEEMRRAGGTDVVLARQQDGTYGPQPIADGVYGVGRSKLAVRRGRVSDLEAGAVRIRVAEGRVFAEPLLREAPEKLVFEGTAGRVVLARGENGVYGPEPATPGQYRLGSSDILFPEERLEPGGPTLDLGTSIASKVPVVEYLRAPLLNTIILGFSAIVVDLVLGVLLGVLAAIRKGTRLDTGLTLGSLFVYSMPGFWLGLMLVLGFAVNLEWLPAEGMHDVGETGFLDLLEHLVLPTVVLGVAAAAGTARYQRAALLEVLGSDYVRTARAKGLPERTVVWKHALRNALLPVITLLGLYLPFLVSGAVITETIFSWPGIGRETIKAIQHRDVFVLSGITIIATTMVVVGSILADVLYAAVDPRVRLR